MPPPETGSVGGGGADLDLIVQHVGLGDVVDKYKELIEEIKRNKAVVSDAEIAAAKRLGEEAREAAAEFSEAAGIAKKTGEESEVQSQAFARVFTEYKQLVTAIDTLRAAVLEEDGEDDGGGEDDEEDEEGARTGAKKRGSIAKKVGDFFNVGKQSIQALGAAGRMVGSTITTMGVGGVVGLLLYGLSYEDKLRAEGERYSQLWEKTIATGDAKGYAVAKQHMATLGSQFANLVDTFRMSKGEAMAVTRSLTDAGVTIEEATAKTSIRVDGARASVAIATAAIDQTLRLPEGTAARTAGQLMQQYNITAREATELVGTFALAGRDSGIGIQNFMSDVMSATGQMRQYGATVQDGLNMVYGLQKMLEEKGLEPHFAATTAVMATGQIAAGLAGMSKGMQMAVADKMGLGTDLGAYYALRDAYMDPSKGPGVALKMARATVDLFRGGRKLSREEIGVALERVMPQLGPQSALIMIQAVDTLHNTNATKKERVDAEKAFNEAFKKERATHTDFETSFKDISRDIAVIGLGLFNLIAVGLAELVIGFRYIPLALKDKLSAIPGFSNLTESEKRQMGRLEDTFWEAETANEKILKDIGKGFTDLGKHGKDLLPSSAGMDAFMGAVTTPEAVKRMAALTFSAGSKEAITAAMRTSGEMIRGVSRQQGGMAGVGATATLGVEQQLALSAAQRGGDFEAVQDILSEAAESAPGVQSTFAGTDLGAGDIAITGVEFGTVRGENLPVTIHFVTIESDKMRRVAVRAGAEKSRGALTSVAPPTAHAAHADSAAEEGHDHSHAEDDVSGVYSGPHGDKVVQADPLRGKGALLPGSFGHAFAKAVGSIGAFHAASDIGAAGGTPVFSPVTGIVKVARPSHKGQASTTIHDPVTGLDHYLAHLKHPLLIKRGEKIEAGDPVGELMEQSFSPPSTPGAPFHKGAPHLHYRIVDPGVKKSSDPRERRVGAIDPYPYIAALRKRG